MMPPRCETCGKDFRGAPRSGKLLRFALSPKDKTANQSMTEKGYVGHPRGAHWFCKDHWEDAKQYTHLHFSDAIKIIRRTNAKGTPPPPNDKPAHPSQEPTGKKNWFARLLSKISGT